MVSFPVLLTLTAAAGAGYVAARQLMTEEAAVRIERLPEGARGPARSARARLLRARDRGREALREARAEQSIAEQELLAEYLRKVGRP